jgi:hypothetical protein
MLRCFERTSFIYMITKIGSAGAMRGKLTTATGHPPVKHFPGEGLRQRQRTVARRTLHARKTSRAEPFV